MACNSLQNFEKQKYCGQSCTKYYSITKLGVSSVVFELSAPEAKIKGVFDRLQRYYGNSLTMQFFNTKILPSTHIQYFRIAHNALCLPPKILHKHCFQFLLGRLYVPREIYNNTYANFGGQTKFIMGNSKITNRKILSIH